VKKVASSDGFKMLTSKKKYITKSINPDGIDDDYSSANITFVFYHLLVFLYVRLYQWDELFRGRARIMFMLTSLFATTG